MKIPHLSILLLALLTHHSDAECERGKPTFSDNLFDQQLHAISGIQTYHQPGCMSINLRNGDS